MIRSEMREMPRSGMVTEDWCCSDCGENLKVYGRSIKDVRVKIKAHQKISPDCGTGMAYATARVWA